MTEGKEMFGDMDKNLPWLSLSRIDGIGNKTLLHIFDRCNKIGLNVEDFWNLPDSELIKDFNLKSKVVQAIFRQKSNADEARNVFKKLHSKKVRIVTLEDECYPKRLKGLEHPPFILYCYGEIDLLQKNPVAITGSRTITLKGLETVYKFSKLLFQHDVTIIKGNTKELDALAHIATEETQGSEITVLSDGILTFLQKVEKTTARIDPAECLLLSFVDPLLSWTVRGERERNKIIFALSNNIIITEARQNGIVMEEGMSALRNGKKLFVVRYEQYPENAAGNRELIEKGGVPISTLDTIANLREVVQSAKREKAQPASSDKEKRMKQKKDLGQFFTPLEVVSFMYEMLKVLWNGRISEDFKIIDPACGEGVFLKYALDEGITTGENLYGCDIDEDVKEKWNAFGIRDKMKLFVQDGLLNSKELGIEREKFDLVIGNPPYGGTGLTELEQLLDQREEETETEVIKPLSLFDEDEEQKAVHIREKRVEYSTPLSEQRKTALIQLANALGEFYTLWRKGGAIEGYEEGNRAGETIDLFAELEKVKPGRKRVELIVEKLQKLKLLGKGKEQLHLSMKDLKKLVSFPIEVLFIERFVQLAKLGGHIAIIIPDGILANVNLKHVQEWLFEMTQVLAVVSLPRETFKHIGTTAKTSILFLRKLQNGEISDKKRPIFMAEAEYVGLNHKRKNDLPQILVEFEKFIKSEKVPKVCLSPMLTSATGEDVLRTGRFDPGYWDPKYLELVKKIRKRFKVASLGDFISFITYGQVGKRVYDKKGTVKYLQVINITKTGIDFWVKPALIKEDSHNDPKRSRLGLNDILLVNHGVGSIGKCITISKDPGKINISQDIDLIRVEEISPSYICVFLNTKFGQQQIERQYSGVSGIIYIRFQDVKAIQVPILTEKIQDKIAREYKKMSRWHDKAMDVKKRLIESGLSNAEADKDLEYQKNIRKAESILGDLIKKTEEVIEGKRDDI